MRATFSISEALSFGWSTLKGHVGLIIGLFIGSVLAMAVPNVLQAATIERAPALGYVFMLLGLVVGSVVSIGLVNIMLMFYDGKTPELSNLFDRLNLLIPYILSSLAYSVVVSIGTLLLVVPGIIAAIKLQFYMYRIVDSGSGPIEALKESWAITNGVGWKLFGWAILIYLINLAGALALVVGLFVTVPVTALARTFIYRKLQEGTRPAPVGATLSV